MEPILYIDRQTGKLEEEKVYGVGALKFLYGKTRASQWLGRPLAYLLSRIPFFSAFYGFCQKLPWSCSKVKPFIQDFNVDASEFLVNPDTYASFNDFFIRKLKPEARPIAAGEKVAVIPADGRYLFYQNIHAAEGFAVKGEKFNLATLLEDDQLAAQYREGTMVIARLCPSDYHRFHFPCDCIPGPTHFINGWLFSVNPVAIKKDIHIFTQNKRTLCELETQHFGKVLFLEIGATNVGSIHETYTPLSSYRKGDEKGYFSFGASALIVLFPPDSIILDKDLTAHPQREIKCLMGQSLGTYPPFKRRDAETQRERRED